MKFCIGHPYCSDKIEDDRVACSKCWRKLSRRMRHEILAVMKHWKDTPQYRKIKKEVEQMLHARLKVIIHRKEERLRYTVVG